MPTWRLILDGRFPARQNMARDLALFEEVQHGAMDGCLRVYNWDTPAVTVGYHQKTFRLYDPTLDIPILRRPTGGGAVLHVDDITYCIAGPIAGAFAGGILDVYTATARMFARALQHCGLEVSMHGADARYASVCFDRAATLELVLDGHKLMGAAQVRRGGFFLQQGVIPRTVDAELYARVFGPQAGLPVGILQHRTAFSQDAFLKELCRAFQDGIGQPLALQGDDA